MPYVPSNDPAVLNATNEVTGVLDRNIETDVGKAAYATLMNNNSLTGRQKQAVCCEVGRHVVSQGTRAAIRQEATFLRESSAGTGFMTAVINDVGGRYIEAVKDKALTSGQQHGHANVNTIAKEIVDSITEQKHKLSADACEFMSACEAGFPNDIDVSEQTKAKRILEASVLLLRGIGPAIATARAKVMGDPNASQAKKDASLAAFEASKAVQQFANSMSLNFAVAEDVVPLPATVFLTEDDLLKQQFTNTLSSMGAGDYNQLQQGAPMSVKDTLKQRVGTDTRSKLAQAETKLDTRQQKLDAMLTQHQTGQQTINLLEASFDANKDNSNAKDQILQGQHTVREMQKVAKKLDGKIQSQLQKIDHTEARVDDLKTRIGRR